MFSIRIGTHIRIISLLVNLIFFKRFNHSFINFRSQKVKVVKFISVGFVFSIFKYHGIEFLFITNQENVDKFLYIFVFVVIFLQSFQVCKQRNEYDNTFRRMGSKTSNDFI